MTVEPLYESDNPALKPSKSSVFLKRILTLLWGLSWALIVVVALLFIAALSARLGVQSMLEIFDEISPLTVMLFCISAFVAAGALLIIIKQLRQICHTLVLGDPFVPENARRLRIIWITVAAAEIFRLVSGLFIPVVHSTTAAGETVTMSVEFRFYVWFLVLALIVLAEVFREGARLRREQKLTI